MKKILYILVLIVGVCTSCKEYLDVKPKGQTIPETPEEFSAMLQYHLDRIDYEDVGDYEIMGDAVTVLYYEFFSDNLDASLTFYPEGKSSPVYIGSKINTFQDKYEDLYKVIGDCNIIIDNMKEKDTELGKKVLATAYALRGVCYYNLLRLFCEPYDKTKETEMLGLSVVERFDVEARPVRNNMKETVAFIEKTLKDAIAFHQTDKVFRFTEDVAKAYLAKLYFWTQNWDQAIAVSEEILEKYPLLEGAAYKDMIEARYDQKGSVILKSYVYGPRGDWSYGLSVAEAKVRPVSEELVNLFVEKEKDARYTLSFDKKRLNIKRICSCVRSDEMCLIMAESYAHKSDVANALKYLNLLRSKRITDYVPYTGSTLPAVDATALIKVDATGKTLTPLISAILNERRKELYMEADRWFELKRNGRPEFWVAADGRKYETLKYFYTAPLPKEDVDYGAGIIQNEGYTE